MTCMDSDILARPMTEPSASVLAVVCVYSQFVFCSYFLAVSVFRKRFTQTTAGSLRCDVNHWSVSEPYADAYSHYGPITIAIRARFEYDSTTIRLRFGYNTLRDAYDSTTIRGRYNILRGVMCFRAIMNMSILSRCCRML